MPRTKWIRLFQALLALVLHTTVVAGPGWTQEGGWLGARVTSGAGIRFDMQGMTLLPAEATRVTEVVADGPASAAGVKVGDVIDAIDGEPTPDGRIFTEKIRSRQPGSTVVLRIRRGGEVSELGVVLGERPKHVLAQGEGWLGLTLAGGSKMIFDPKTQTWTKTELLPLEAEVSRVYPNGPAAAAGILRNDVILALDHEPIATGKELSDKLRLREPGSTVLLRVKRGDDIQDIKVVLGTRPAVRELGPGERPIKQVPVP